MLTFFVFCAVPGCIGVVVDGEQRIWVSEMYRAQPDPHAPAAARRAKPRPRGALKIFKDGVCVSVPAQVSSEYTSLVGRGGLWGLGGE